MKRKDKRSRKNTKSRHKVSITTEHEIGFTDKLSRLFYNWMRRPTAPMRNLRAGPFEIKTFVCEGAFGKVMTATNIHTNATVAAKLESKKLKHPHLQLEYKMYELLGSEVPGFPKIYHYGPCDKKYNVLVMELLGPDLGDLFHACNNIFSHKTILNIAMQILMLLKHIHSKNMIYRDIKAENFCIGHHFQNKQNIIYVVDFGLAKLQGDAVTKASALKCSYLVGTARYMSMNAHCALELSKRDDLQSLGYLLAYFLKGKLPWMGISDDCDDTNTLFEDIADEKKNFIVEQFMPNCPEFITYMNYVLELDFKEEPDYTYMYKLFKDSYELNGYEYDNKFDWTDIMNKKFLAESIEVDPDD